MKLALLLFALASADAGTPCVVVVQRPSGPVKRACAPEPKTPPSCVVRVLRPDGSAKTVPCQ